jgi:hypothetical protein
MASDIVVVLEVERSVRHEQEYGSFSWTGPSQSLYIAETWKVLGLSTRVVPGFKTCYSLNEKKQRRSFLEKQGSKPRLHFTETTDTKHIQFLFTDRQMPRTTGLTIFTHHTHTRFTRTFARALLRDYFYSSYIQKYNLPFCIHKIIFGKSCPQYLCLDQLV